VLADLIRAAVQLVMRDRIVAGLVIVLILGFFYCGVNKQDSGGHRFISKQSKGDQGGQNDGGQNEGAQDDKGQGQQTGDKGQGQGAGSGKGDEAQGQGKDQGQGQGQSSTTPQNGGKGPQSTAASQAGPKLEPKLAMDFVRWWLTMALDYSVNSAANHKKAMAYAKPQVAKIFSQSFYTREVMQGVANGTLAGAFEPVTVQAIAINPDGSVVVTVIGTLSMQSSGSQPVSQSLVLEFLVEKDPEGVHMSGFFNKTITQPPAGAPAATDAAPSEPPQSLGQ
jgi:hypothetical protein